MRRQTIIAVIGMLYMLPEKWRGVGSSDSFHMILKAIHRRPSLQAALIQMAGEGLLEGVYEDIDWHPLYEVTNVGQVLLEACKSLLVRFGGNPQGYHLDVLSEAELLKLLHMHGIDFGTIRCASQRLLELLEEQALETNSPAA